MSAHPAMVAAVAQACVPLVPYQPPRCSSCGRCARPYGGPADQPADGSMVCTRCVEASFAESG